MPAMVTRYIPWRATACGLSLLTGSCASMTATPPQVELRQVQLRGVGLLDQALAVDLCVTNPNDAVLAFRRVTVNVEVNGAPLAEAVSDDPVRVPPRSSVDVPFNVTTTLRNIGPQLLGVLRTGAIAYRLHGTVQLAGALSLTLPFSRTGQLGLAPAALGVLNDTALPVHTSCGSS